MRISNQQTPEVSVLVPAFNQEEYIGRCLRSLLHQTMRQTDYEIVVINDGSTDLTRYAVSQFSQGSESNIQYIEHKQNSGLPSALNTGIMSARGRFIVRVDSDDFVNQNYLTFLHAYLTLNNKARAVSCDYFLVDDKEVVIKSCCSREEPIGCGIMFYKADIVKIGLYDEAMLVHEDKDFRLRFEEFYAIDHLAIPLYRYRRHETNITSDIMRMKRYMDKLENKHKEN